MPPLHRHAFTISLAQLDAAQGALEQALLARAEASRARLAPLRRVMRWTTFAVAVVGLLFLLLFAPPWRYPQFVRPLVTLVAVLALLAGLRALDRPSNRWSRERCAVIAQRLLAPVRARAPYEIEYVLDDVALRTEAKALGARYELKLSEAGQAIAAGEIVCLYRWRFSPTPFRVLLAPTDSERGVLLDRLRQAGVEVAVIA